MPIVWRYLLSNYLKVLCLCVFAFVGILLTTRLDEIARFATLGPESTFILLFTLQQILYILPIALPIACLISAILLMQRLSRTHELTALRAAGLSLASILTPILLAAALLFSLNLYVVSELSTQAHLASGMQQRELRAINPLLLMHNRFLTKMKGLFFLTLGPSKLGESAEQVIVAIPNKTNNRINLLLAEKLRASSKKLVGTHVSIITSMTHDFADRHDNLAIENISDVRMSVEDFGHMMHKNDWVLRIDHLKMPMLLAKLAEDRQNVAKAAPEELKSHRRCVAQCYSEILRRVSLSFAAFSFTLLGCSFGVGISRTHSNRGLFMILGLAALFLVAYFIATGLADQGITAGLLYTLPHLLIIVASIFALKKASAGVEG